MSADLMAGIQVSAGGEVALRPLHVRDAARFAEALNDPVTRHWMHGVPDPYTEVEAYQSLRAVGVSAETSDPYWAWAVVDSQDELQGKVSLSDYDGTSVNVAYWSHPMARGRGWMTGAVRSLVDAAFAADLGLLAVRACVAAENRSSRALLHRIGFMPTDTYTDYRMGDGTYAEGVRSSAQDSPAPHWRARAQAGAPSSDGSRTTGSAALSASVRRLLAPLRRPNVPMLGCPPCTCWGKSTCDSVRLEMLRT
nr:GNAT family N-acetyltransferase [uncultured Nocardioides sp.]